MKLGDAVLLGAIIVVLICFVTIGVVAVVALCQPMEAPQFNSKYFDVKDAG